jgi:Asp-tRNA(Asn)/Glu-tRNA(Gln) amidotransferase A subunit family amidase
MPIDYKSQSTRLPRDRSLAPAGGSLADMLEIRDIEGAERLAGVSYTAAEREQMLDNLESQIAAAVARRQLKLANASPPALRFDPRPPGFTTPAGRSGVRVSRLAAKPLPSNEEDIAYASVNQLSHWLDAGAITSRRLTEIYLARIAKLGPKLECFAAVAPERALAEADAADARARAGGRLSPLHGVPYGLKDLFDTKGLVTGWGAEPFSARVPERDAAIVTKLRAAGAVLLGKTTVGALAFDDRWYGGRTRNPWNLDEGSSGSSAGSASATAAALCAFSIGTETLGSITSPSHRCGTTGLRPTFGRVSRAGGMALCWSLDKVGPICRTVEDTALVLAALNGADIDDPSTIAAPFAFDADASIRGATIGYLPEAFGEGANEIDRVALEAARRLGANVVEATLEDLPYFTLLNVLCAEAAAAFEDLTLDNLDDTLSRQDAGAWPNTFRKARFLSAVDHVQLDRLRYRAMLALDKLFGEVDFLIGPFMTGPMLVASNFTGHPCLHLRAGFVEQGARGPALLGGVKLTTGEGQESGPKRRVPHGISLWGRLFDEGRLLNFGLALERELGVVDMRPDL